MVSNLHINLTDNNFINAPVVHYEDDHLCEGQEELTQVWDSVISVIHTREVDHVHSINHPFKIVQERDCGTLDSCGTYRDLQEKQIMMYTCTVSKTLHMHTQYYK